MCNNVTYTRGYTMANTLLAHTVPSPGVNTILYNVDGNSAYMMCELVITSLNDIGLTFNLALTRNSTPSIQDYIRSYNSPILNSSNQSVNHFIINDLFVATGENIIVYTSLPNISFRLTGYPYPFNNQQLNIT